MSDYILVIHNKQLIFQFFIQIFSIISVQLCKQTEETTTGKDLEKELQKETEEGFWPKHFFQKVE